MASVVSSTFPTRRRLIRSVRPHSHITPMPTPEETHDDEWTKVWDARMAALTPILGKPADTVFHATIPFQFRDAGGSADVVPFPSYAPGATYVTAELTGTDVGQRPSSLGHYSRTRRFAPCCSRTQVSSGKIEKEKMVGATGFEPATSWSQTKCSTRLSYAPTTGNEVSHNAAGAQPQSDSK